MALISRKPTSPGRRFQTATDFAEITRSEPEKSLVRPLKKTGGRNCHGRVTIRFRGGGHKRRYRLIDFKRNKPEVPAKVASIEYDPNRTTRIALLHYVDGEKRYILAPQDLRVGDMVVSSPNADIKPGNTLPLSNIPNGTLVHNVEMKPGKGGQMARAAGSAAQLMAKEGKQAHLKLPSTISGESNVVMQLSMDQAAIIRAGKLKPLANMSDRSLNISGYGEVPPITKWYPNFPPIGSHFGIMIAKGAPPEVVAAVSKAFDVAAKSEALAKFADQKAVFLVNLKGAEADKKMEEVASVVTWALFDTGSAKISPAQFNIPKPKQ